MMTFLQELEASKWLCHHCKVIATYQQARNQSFRCHCGQAFDIRSSGFIQGGEDPTQRLADLMAMQATEELTRYIYEHPGRQDLVEAELGLAIGQAAAKFGDLFGVNEAAEMVHEVIERLERQDSIPEQEYSDQDIMLRSDADLDVDFSQYLCVT